MQTAARIALLVYNSTNKAIQANRLLTGITGIEQTGVGEITTANSPRLVVGSSTLRSHWVHIAASWSNHEVLFVGKSGVSSANGFPVFPGEKIGLNLNNAKQALYAVSAHAGDKWQWKVLS